MSYMFKSEDFDRLRKLRQCEEYFDQTKEEIRAHMANRVTAYDHLKRLNSRHWDKLNQSERTEYVRIRDTAREKIAEVEQELPKKLMVWALVKAFIKDEQTDTEIVEIADYMASL
jgi:hypothetical protein